LVDVTGRRIVGTQHRDNAVRLGVSIGTSNI
jgi:hypothetical protein